MNAQTNIRYIDIDSLCNEAEAAGMAWADAKAAHEALDQTRKTVLAQGVRSHMGEGPFNKAEVLALADDSYLEFIKRLVHAGRAADRARVRYDMLKTRIELLRTNASTERAAMSMR
jgi:hypothetical protein